MTVVEQTQVSDSAAPIIEVKDFVMAAPKFSGSADAERAMGMDIMGEQAEKLL
jgi:hypothetical protein